MNSKYAFALRLAEKLLGQDILESVRRGGILHVVATVCEPEGDGVLRVMNINQNTPKSSDDYFMLNFARAVADANLTSGRNLACEESLNASIQGEFADGLLELRSDLNGLAKGSNPILAGVLTRGRDGAMLQHSFFNPRPDVETIVLTDQDGASNLSKHLKESGSNATITSLPFPVSVYSALSHMVEMGRRQLGGSNPLVTVECGPSVMQPLYSKTALWHRAPVPDIVLMSVLRAEDARLDPSVIGERLTTEAFLTTEYQLLHTSTTTGSDGQRWEHRRYERKDTGVGVQL